MTSAAQVSTIELLSRITQGDPNALAALYDEFERPVYGLLIGILKDTDDAEDVMQEVFAQVWKKADSYQPILGSPKNWILKIAHNMAINYLRSRAGRHSRDRVSIEEVQNSPSLEPLQSEVVGLTEEIAYLNKALQALPVEQSYLISLAFMQGLSHSEIAEQTAIPLGTVKTRIRTGLSNLRSHLAPLAQDHQINNALRQSTRSNNV
jgi:RNA polymerase sigma-70 factor, ECF subfamily